MALIVALAVIFEAAGVAGEKDSGPALHFNKQKVLGEINRFLSSRTASNGLVASFGDTAPYTFSIGTGKFHERWYGKLGAGDDQAYTYDMALAAIGYLLEGKTEQAEKILDAMETDFPQLKNGIPGLFNSYLVTSRIPVEDLQPGVDGNRIHAGPTLWVALAALNHVKLQRNTRYLGFALDIVNWSRTRLTYFRFPDGERGAISMGMGWGPDWSKIFATEHNVDYYAVLRMLHGIYSESPEEVRAIFAEKKITDAWLQDEMAHIGRWLKEVPFDNYNYCFRAGFALGNLDRTKVVDGTSWGIGGVGPENLEALGIDLDRLMESTEKHLRCSYELPGGGLVYGFDLTDPEGYGHHRQRLIWFEATGQMIVAYGELARHFGRKGEPDKARKYEAKAVEYVNSMHEFQKAYGLKGCLPYMSVNPGPKQILKTMKDEWEIPRARDQDVWVGSLSSSIWMLYCLHDFYNPMKWEKKPGKSR